MVGLCTFLNVEILNGDSSDYYEVIKLKTHTNKWFADSKLLPYLVGEGVAVVVLTSYIGFILEYCMMSYKNPHPIPQDMVKDILTQSTSLLSICSWLAL